ncbi:MAG: gluconokinase, GntK/IdnK-type [Nitrospira sp.]|nr:gluconokinase, GntK/IdnK-type [Nitrospira sp.]
MPHSQLSKTMSTTVHVIILMGAAGAGKSTVGRQLANELGWWYVDGDDFHPAANLDKINHNLPLTDEDRRPWLEHLRTALTGWVTSGTYVVLACSLLKAVHRARVLGHTKGHVRIAYLKADRPLLKRRLLDRTDHVMKVDLLDSQLETLEEPMDALFLDASEPPQRLVQRILDAFEL